MKQNPFLGLTASIVIIAASVCITVSGENNTPKISDLMTKNIEALSRDEGPSGTYKDVYYRKSSIYHHETHQYAEVKVLVCEYPGNRECKGE